MNLLCLTRWFRNKHSYIYIYTTNTNTDSDQIIQLTRQSEMANTSTRHMPVLGNVHPIKIENFDIFS